MNSRRFVHHDEAVAFVTVGENETVFFERGAEGSAAVGLFKTIKNSRADPAPVDAKPTCCFLLVAVVRTSAVVGLPRVAHFPQAKFHFARARYFHQAILKKAWITCEASLSIDAEPGRMHVHLSGRLINVKAPRARQTGEPKPLFFPIERLFPLRQIQSLSGCQPGLRMKPRLLAARRLKRQALHNGRRGTQVRAEEFEAACASEFHALTLHTTHEIIDQLHAIAVEIALTYHAA